MAAMDDGELRTSDEWQRGCTVKVVDPDGWDRSPSGFHRSFYEERITRAEFESRLARSTVWMTRPMLDDDGNVRDIWIR